ncbi:Hypothetical protein CM240_1278 [Clostridium bornimense]|uniref:Uncharacterized protein n=1 Tax=Clostridium bornimense TaxID=1216932 RepID=W6S2C4_9CLOT|nr:hypothetical protein [Clostridium bornimense]CDM68442.1 Hypothetical protein CM240_1278 [Clostridium bornimense]
MENLNIPYELKDIYEKYFRKYKDILEVINLRKNQNNISEITQSEIASKLNISQTLVSKCLIRLEHSDKCVKRIKAVVYKVNHTDLMKYGPFNKFVKYLVAIVEIDNFMSLKLKEQAVILHMTKNEIKKVRAYIKLL